MIFAIYGVNFQNKGAELMLYATQEKIKEWDKTNSVACHLLIGNFEQRNSKDISHLMERRIYRFPKFDNLTSLFSKLIPSFIRAKNNLILESEVDVIFDASGFAYSDQWGPDASQQMAKRCLKWKRQNKKIILLPQAFGPFENPQVKEAFITIANNVDLIFARDDISYNYISNLPISLANVKIAPDFTNLVKPQQTSYIKDLANRIAIVPNQRMLDKTLDLTSNQYFEFLTKAINYLHEQKKNPFILVHETKDIDLAQKLKLNIKKPIQIIQEENPLILKGILGQSDFVIGSRFHSLISALSQNIPCIGTGWSHKYQTLFQEYNCSELLVTFEVTNMEVSLNKLNLLLNYQSKSEIVNKIKVSSEKQKELSQLMWEKVQSTVYSK